MASGRYSSANASGRPTSKRRKLDKRKQVVSYFGPGINQPGSRLTLTTKTAEQERSRLEDRQHGLSFSAVMESIALPDRRIDPLGQKYEKLSSHELMEMVPVGDSLVHVDSSKPERPTKSIAVYLFNEIWEKILDHVTPLDLLTTRHVSRQLRECTLPRFRSIIFSGMAILRELTVSRRYFALVANGKKGYWDVLGEILDAHGEHIHSMTMTHLGYFGEKEPHWDGFLTRLVRNCKHNLVSLRVDLKDFHSKCNHFCKFNFECLTALESLQVLDGVLYLGEKVSDWAAVARRLTAMESVETVIFGTNCVDNVIIYLKELGLLSRLDAVKNVNLNVPGSVECAKIVELFPELEGVLVRRSPMSTESILGLLPKSLKRLFLFSPMTLRQNQMGALATLTNISEFGINLFGLEDCNEFSFLGAFKKLESIEVVMAIGFTAGALKLVPTKAPLKRVRLVKCRNLDCNSALEVLTTRKYCLTDVVLHCGQFSGDCNVKHIQRFILSCKGTIERIELEVDELTQYYSLRDLLKLPFLRLHRVYLRNLTSLNWAMRSLEDKDFVQERRQLFGTGQCGLLDLCTRGLGEASKAICEDSNILSAGIRIIVVK